MQTGAGTFYNSIKNWAVQILPADASALKTLVTAASTGSKVETIIVTSTDTAARDVTLVITKSAVDYPIATKTIPITAGTIAATSAVLLLESTTCPWLRYDENGNPYLLLETGSVLKVKALTTVTAAKEIDVFAYGKE